MLIEKEKAVVQKMILLYCRLNHNNKALCADCKELLLYASQKLDKCPLKQNKPSCKKCPIHCYSSDKKEKIKEVMRFSGPRILMYHPRAFLMHLLK